MACELTGNRYRYTRRIFTNGAIHYCIQDTETLDLIKSPQHDYRPFIRHDEIPPGETIYRWVDPEDTQGGLFDVQ